MNVRAIQSMTVIAAPGQRLAGRKILIVEDDRLNQVILTRILQRDGFVVCSATSGETAFDVYTAEQPDLVLLDVVLPGMNGFEAARQLQERTGENCAPIIFITALTESDDVARGYAAGGVDYVHKPFRIDEVLARIRFHLAHQLLNLEQSQLIEELSIANAAKNKFLGVAVHDLRNPLASIRSLAEFLEDDVTGPLNDEQRELVATIRQASDGMLAVVNKLVEPSVLELGEHINLNIQTGSVGQLVEKEVAVQNINAARKGSRIELTIAMVADDVRFDPVRLQQVISHALRNALRFSPARSVITVIVTATSKEWVIFVRDQGPGMPEIHQRKLREGFAPNSVPTAKGRRSSGVGLAICRQIMLAHGGFLSAENLTGGGCSLRISLPHS